MKFIYLYLFLVLSEQSFANDFLSDLENLKNSQISIKITKNNLESSKQVLISKKLFWTPSIYLNASESRAKSNLSDLAKNNQISINADWNLIKGGADFFDYKSSALDTNLKEFELLNETIKAEYSAGQILLKSIYLTKNESIQNEFLNLKSESVKIITNRYKQGLTPIQEVDKTIVDYNQQKMRLRKSEIETKENKMELKFLSVEKIKTQEWPYKSNKELELNLEKNIDEKNLELLHKKLIFDSSDYQYKKSLSNFFPTLDFKFQYALSPIKNDSEKTISGVFSLTFPIWDKWETIANKAQQHSALKNSEIDFLNTKKNLTLKNELLLEKLNVARVNLNESENNLKISKKLYSDVMHTFKLGRISINDLFNEQNRFLESEINYQNSQLEFHQILIENCLFNGISLFKCL